MAEEVLDRRDLNRATLAPQMLLACDDRPATAAMAHLVGLQAQHPFAPYFGLWSRLDGFTADDLAGLLEQRDAVRILLQRGTIHLVTATDAGWLRPLVQPAIDRGLSANRVVATALDGVDLDLLTTTGRTLLEDAPHTLAELGPVLGAMWPDRDPAALAQALRLLLPLVQVPPRAVWGRTGRAACTTLEAWVGARLDPSPSRVDLVRRYLGAYGPASVLDAQRWSGLTMLGEAFERLRPDLVSFRDTPGRELFDLPDAPRPGSDAVAPVRLVAAFDNVLLGHDDRSRVFAAEHKRRLFPVNGVIPATVLVDGFVTGTWTWTATRATATVTLAPFRRWPVRVARQAEREAERLLAVAAPAVPAHAVVLVDPGERGVMVRRGPGGGRRRRG